MLKLRYDIYRSTVYDVRRPISLSYHLDQIPVI